MDVAEQIVVMNEGRVEQAGAPVDLYEDPSSEFVMGFVGPVNKLGDSFIRPHDLDILHVPDPGSQEAQIERIVQLGFEVRIELALADGKHLWAQLTKAQVEELELENTQIVYVRPRRQRIFNGAGEPTTAEERLSAS
jgi:sulfate transport system ATP-binding protein